MHFKMIVHSSENNKNFIYIEFDNNFNVKNIYKIKNLQNHFYFHVYHKFDEPKIKNNSTHHL